MRWVVGLCLRRPLGVLAVYAALCAWGVRSWFALPRELMPDLRFPQLTVVTRHPNATPEEVENLLTKPVEQAIGVVKNLRRVESVSREGLSLVTVQFKWGTDMDAAPGWLNEKLGLIQDQLPQEASRPQVVRHNPFQLPVLILSLTGPLGLTEMQRLAETRLIPELEKADGVASVSATGGREREIQVLLDGQKLAANDLSILSVTEALRQRNVSRSAGTTSEGLFEYPVTVLGSFDTPESIQKAVIRSDAPRGPAAGNGASAFITLESLGRVVDGLKERAGYSRYDGRENISVAVHKRAEAPPLTAVRNALKALERAKPRLPAGLKVDVVYDQSTAIRQGISSVFFDLALGAFLAFGILWAFLKNLKGAASAAVIIPVAGLMTLSSLQIFGLSLNLLTLGGLSLGSGLVVDSAIALQENAARHLAFGHDRLQALENGLCEVGGGVIFSTLASMAAFVPIPFALVGVAREVFFPLCLTFISSQVVSIIVAFTLIPSLSRLMSDSESGGPGLWAKMLEAARLYGEALLGALPKLGAGRLRSSAGRLHARAEAEARALFARYDRALQWSLDHRSFLLWAVLGATLANGSLLFWGIRRESMPRVDQAQFLVRAALPVGSGLELTNAVAARLEELLSDIPEVGHVLVTVGAAGGGSVQALGPNEADLVVSLKPKRRRTVYQAAADLKRRLAGLDVENARVDVIVQGSDVFSQALGSQGADISVEVKGQNMDDLRKDASDLARDLRSIAGVRSARAEVPAPTQQTQVRMDETQLARDGLSVMDVAETLAAGIHGSVATRFRDQGREYDVRVQLRPEDRKDAFSLSHLGVFSPIDRTSKPLSNYGALALETSPSEIRRVNQERCLTVLAEAPSRLEQALPRVADLLETYRARTPGLSFSLGSEVEERRAAFQSVLLGFIAAVALVFFVLVAQFNSLWQPGLIMAAVPLTVNGVAPALYLSGNSLNMMSGLGMMLLAGIVVSNSIVLLEFAEQRKGEGASGENAILDAGRVRLKPICMTALATVMGLAPLALGIGAGAEAIQAPMAITVICGLAASTGLTLLVMPALYSAAQSFFKTPPPGSAK